MRPRTRTRILLLDQPSPARRLIKQPSTFTLGRNELATYLTAMGGKRVRLSVPGLQPIRWSARSNTPLLSPLSGCGQISVTILHPLLFYFNNVFSDPTTHPMGPFRTKLNQMDINSFAATPPCTYTQPSDAAQLHGLRTMWSCSPFHYARLNSIRHVESGAPRGGCGWPTADGWVQPQQSRATHSHSPSFLPHTP